MKTLFGVTSEMIARELETLPKQYQDKNFNSTHEGYAVILEEVRELENEVFFGEKRAREELKNDLNREWAKEEASRIHKQRMRDECIQVAAMCVRFIQELTTNHNDPL
jgi:hypothetical protein